MISVAVTCSALVYRGKRGERFSLFNHFISELGERGVSRGAWAFNNGLVVGGLLLLPFALRLGTALGSPLGWAGAFFAAAAALGAAAVGLFPMNTLRRHVPAATVFFYGGLFTVIVVGIAILVQPGGQGDVPRTASLLSLPAALAFGSFVVVPPIVMPNLGRTSLLDPRIMPERPRFWILPILEWLVFVTTILWLMGMSLFLPR